MTNAVLREKPDVGNPHGNAIGTHVRLFFACILALPLFPANAGDSSNETWSVCVDGRPLQLERQEILTYKKGVKPYFIPLLVFSIGFLLSIVLFVLNCKCSF